MKRTLKNLYSVMCVKKFKYKFQAENPTFIDFQIILQTDIIFIFYSKGDFGPKNL